MMAPKAWRQPHSETLSLFLMAALGGASTGAAVGSFSAPLLVYPVYYFLVNAGLATMIAHRRTVLATARLGRTTTVTREPSPDQARQRSA
jgi:hypothetical protein